jgi:hypothetical protein
MTKYCLSVLEKRDIRVPARDINNFSKFSCSFSNSLSDEYTSAPNEVCSSKVISRNVCLNENVYTLFLIYLFLLSSLCIRAASVTELNYY